MRIPLPEKVAVYGFCCHVCFIPMALRTTLQVARKRLGASNSSDRPAEQLSAFVAEVSQGFFRFYARLSPCVPLHAFARSWFSPLTQPYTRPLICLSLKVCECTRARVHVFAQIYACAPACSSVCTCMHACWYVCECIWCVCMRLLWEVLIICKSPNISLFFLGKFKFAQLRLRRACLSIWLFPRETLNKMNFVTSEEFQAFDKRRYFTNMQ